MLFTRVEDLENIPEADHVEGEELDPGVHVSRRQVFRMAAVVGAGALGAVGMTDAVLAGEEATTVPPTSPLSFEEVLAQLRPFSKQLVSAEQPNEEAYLHSIAALLSRLSPIPEVEPTGRGRMKMKALAKYQPLVIYQIDLQPGAKIRLHDHRYYNGVLFGVKGQADVRNFDFHERQDIPPKGKEFLIRETQRLTLTPGRVSTLSRKRDNIHEVVAGRKGARLLDVFTYFSKKAGSHYLNFDDKPADRDRRLYSVEWSRR